MLSWKQNPRSKDILRRISISPALVSLHGGASAPLAGKSPPTDYVFTLQYTKTSFHFCAETSEAQMQWYLALTLNNRQKDASSSRKADRTSHRKESITVRLQRESRQVVPEPGPEIRLQRFREEIEPGASLPSRRVPRSGAEMFAAFLAQKPHKRRRKSEKVSPSHSTTSIRRRDFKGDMKGSIAKEIPSPSDEVASVQGDPLSRNVVRVRNHKIKEAKATIATESVLKSKQAVNDMFGQQQDARQNQQEDYYQKELEIDERDASPETGSWLIFRCFESGEAALRLLVIRDDTIIACEPTSGRLRSRLCFSSITSIQRDLESKLIRINYSTSHGTHFSCRICAL